MASITSTNIITKHPVTGQDIEWSVFGQMTDLPAKRYHYAELAMQKIRAVLTPEELRNRLNEMLDMMNAGKGADFAWAVKELINRLDHFGHEDHYMELAVVWTVCPALGETGEPTEKWNPEVNRLKIEMLKKDDDARFFFIHFAAQLIYDLTNISVTAFPLLLAEQNERWATVVGQSLSQPS